MTTKSNTDRINALINIICQDPGNRQFTGIAGINNLKDAATALCNSHRVLILSGFCVLDSMTGETDGPPGALAVGYALQMLGKEVAYVTDKYSHSLLQKGQDVLDLSSKSQVFSVGNEDTWNEIAGILQDFSPDHVIAIERPGKAADGHSYSMRGERLSHVIPQLDCFFELPFRSQFSTTAIGDGGNEMGMGVFYDHVVKKVPMGRLIASTTTADFVIPAGISNWAGYALAAALSILSGKNAMPPAEADIKMIEVMVEAGSVDGCTKRPELSVDGVPFGVYLKALYEIRRVAESQHYDL